MVQLLALLPYFLLGWELVWKTLPRNAVHFGTQSLTGPGESLGTWHSEVSLTLDKKSAGNELGIGDRDPPSFSSREQNSTWCCAHFFWKSKIRRHHATHVVGPRHLFCDLLITTVGQVDNLLSNWVEIGTKRESQVCAFIDYGKLKVYFVLGEYDLNANTLSKSYHRKLLGFALKCKMLILNPVGEWFEWEGKAFVTWKEEGGGVWDTQTNSVQYPSLQISHCFVLTLAAPPENSKRLLENHLTFLSLIC